MAAGLVFSAILGGLSALAWSITQDHAISGVLASYPMGGLLAVMTFIAYVDLRRIAVRS